MSKNEKIILATTSTLAIVIGVTAAIGTSFCLHAAILFIPAFVPIIAFATYKLIRTNLTKKQIQEV